MSRSTEKFIETIRLENSRFFLLELHQKRINEVFYHFNKKNIYNLKDYIYEIKYDTKNKYKIRVIYDLHGKIDIEITPYFLKINESFELIKVDDLEYSFKFENRENIEKFKSKSTSDEVIFYKNGKITDTSISNLIFKKGEEWFTPETTLLNGVMREFLIKTKQIKIMNINLDNIYDFSHFQMINAMMPFGTKEYEITLIKNLNN